MGETIQDPSSPKFDIVNTLHSASSHCCHHVHQSCCSGHVPSQETTVQLLCKKRSVSPDLMDADVSAIVSALAKQQSEVEDEVESEETQSQISDINYDRKRGGGKKAKYVKRDKKGADNDSTSSDDNNTLSCPRYHISKDLHELSKMFIQTTMLPRPKSDINFRRHQYEDGETSKHCDEGQEKNKETGTHFSDDHHRKRGLEDKHDNEHHGLPLSLSFHPLKTLQKSFHKSDTLYPPTYSSVAYACSQTPPMSGTLAPSASPKISHSTAQHGSMQHCSQSPSTFLKVSSGKASNWGDGATSRSSRSSPTKKYKSKFAKNDAPVDSSLNAPVLRSRSRTPSHGTIPQIVAPTPPGGLPIFVTPIPPSEESIPGHSQAGKKDDKRSKYAKTRPKSSGAMQ